MTTNQFTDKILKAPRLDFGNIFFDAIALFQKVWLQGFLMILLSFVTIMGLYSVMIIPIIASDFIVEPSFVIEQDSGNIDTITSLLLMGLVFLIYIVIIIVATTLNVGLQAAFFRIVRMKDRNKKSEVGVNFGMFLKKKHLKKLFLFSLIYLIIMGVSYVFFILPLFYAMVPMQYALIIYAFHPEWSIKEILKAGFELGNKKWGITFALMFVGGIAAYAVGFLACFVGIYFTTSFILLPGYLIYKEVIGFTEVEDVIAQIGGEDTLFVE